MRARYRRLLRSLNINTRERSLVRRTNRRLERVARSPSFIRDPDFLLSSRLTLSPVATNLVFDSMS